MNSRKHEKLNKIVFNKIVEIVIKVNYKVIQKQHFQSKKKSENLQKFVAEALKLITLKKSCQDQR